MNCLFNAIGIDYKYAVNQEGKYYYGLNLDWNYSIIVNTNKVKPC